MQVAHIYLIVMRQTVRRQFPKVPKRFGGETRPHESEFRDQIESRYNGSAA
jgi:hypothetical protein